VSYRLDHAVYAVRDLDAAADRWWDTFGLASVPGGRHPAWGTANRIVPLGRDYLELLCPVDAEVAGRAPLGRRLLELTAEGDAWFALCLADDDLDATAARLGLPVEAGERARPDGSVIRWRSAGLEAPARGPSLPFFIGWDAPPGEHPGRIEIEHRADVRGISAVEVAGIPNDLRDWLAGADVPITVIADDGPRGVRSVTLDVAGGRQLVVGS
jgi:hypothetical protein